MKKIYIILGLVISAALLCSCDDQLTTSDATKVDAEMFTGSTAGLNQVLTSTYKNFLMGEVRYNSLARSNPERAEVLFNAAVENAKNRYDYLTRLTALYGQD